MIIFPNVYSILSYGNLVPKGDKYLYFLFLKILLLQLSMNLINKTCQSAYVYNYIVCSGLTPPFKIYKESTVRNVDLLTEPELELICKIKPSLFHSHCLCYLLLGLLLQLPNLKDIPYC